MRWEGPPSDAGSMRWDGIGDAPEIVHGSGESISMTYLSEDPTLLAGGRVLLAGACGVALRVTDHGKYLVRGVLAAGLAVAVLVTEWLWVTDNERIEQVVYDLRRAVLNSDTEGVLGHLTPNVQFLEGETSRSGEATRALIRAKLGQAHFDFIRIGGLQTNAGRQSRRGTAEFQVFAKGELQTSVATVNNGTANSVWSLGFQETQPGVWKVNRITPVQVPAGVLAMPGSVPAPDRSRLGYVGGTNGPWAIGRGGLGRRRGEPRIHGAGKMIEPPEPQRQ